MKLNNLKKNMFGLFGLKSDILSKHRKRDHPYAVLFMPKSTCNARCVMCGLDYADNREVSEITLPDYQRMLDNLEMDKVREIAYSGGGDPLLCKDLIRMIDYTKRNYPEVNLFTYTNGIALTQDFSREFIKYNFCRIVISINASTAETYRKVMQVDAFEKVAANIRKLVEIKNLKKAKTLIQLSFVASLLNIDDLPGLITLGSELGVDEINMQYCRFYSRKFKLDSHNCDRTIDQEHSLFFHQAHSDEVVKTAESMARTQKIAFLREPMFNEAPPDKKPCFWPWTTIIIGPQGEIYPCGGADVVFYKSINEGRLFFGNLLKGHISKFWHNEDYKKLRLSCDFQNKNKSIPQCFNCNHTWEWEGINHKASHFIDIDK